jgi:Ca-activated chloride channel family protein
MFTKRILVAGMLVIMLFINSACGVMAPAATETPRQNQEPARLPAISPEQNIPQERPAATQPAEAFAPSAPQAAKESRRGDPTPDAMFFENYGTNPMVDTRDDHLSTFALDVDTGSYTIARSYIRDGNLPPADAVRVEEFVNYFGQGYSYPSERQVFGIYIDGAPSPFTETERYQMLRIGIQGYDVPKSERKDASLTFVIDVSGSMNRENRLELVKKALALLVDQLNERDRVSIVVYGSDARVILEPTPGDERRTILRAIDRLKPEGVTNAEAGLRLGYQMADEAFNRNGINRVILCSDGVANVGDTNPGSIWDQVKRYAGKDITLTTIGFGMGNYNDVLMEQLADNGNGFYAYVDEIDEARRLFVDRLTSTLQTIALDAKVQVDFNPDVVARYRLVGYENRDIADEDFRDDNVDAGEIGAGHSVTALYEIKLFPNVTGRVATIQLRWQDPDTSRVTEISETFDTRDLAESFEAANPYFQWAVIVAEYAEILRNSYWASESSLDDVLEAAERVSRYLEETPDPRELVDLIRKTTRLER